MKYGYQLPVSSYTRYTQYTPTNYTPTYTPALYTAAQYSTAHYTASKYTPTKYAAATNLTTSSLYPASYKTTATSSSYSSSSYSSRTRHGSTATAAAQRLTAAPPPPVPKPAPAAKPVRAVHFPNDIIFQDCVRRGELELIGRFIRCRKVRVDTLFLSGMAPIHEAVLTGNLECVKLLVKYGADVHQRDEDGWTALHMACSDGFPDIASYLLSLGASAEAENESGEKPVDLIDPDCTELAKLFQAGVV